MSQCFVVVGGALVALLVLAGIAGFVVMSMADSPLGRQESDGPFGNMDVERL